MEKNKIKDMVREGINKVPNVLNIFDFDGTLMNTPLPDEGKVKWVNITGKPYPHIGWWSKPESLDMGVFNIKPIASVKSDYNQHKDDGINIMLTGRRKKLGAEVKAILDKNGYTFDQYLYNYGGDTLSNKIEQMGNLLKEYPSIKVLNVWEDRIAHVPTFKQYFEGLVESGRLDSYNVTVVPSGNHG